MANWNPATQPANDGTANLLIGGNVGFSPNVDVPWSVNSLQFGPSAGSTFNIGGNTISIGAGGVSASTAALADYRVNTNIALTADQTWQISNDARLFMGKAGTSIDTAGFTLTLNDTSQQQFQIPGNVIGSGGITVDSGQSIEMSGTANTFTGPVTLNGGSLDLYNSTSLGASSGVVNFNGGGLALNNGAITIARSGIISSNGLKIFSLIGATVGITYNGNLSGAGSLTISGSNVFAILGGANTYGGGTFLKSGSDLVGTTNSLQGAINGDNVAGEIVAINQSFDGTFTGTVTEGTGKISLQKEGTGTVTLTGTQTVSGMFVTGGTFKFGSGLLLPNLSGLEVGAGAILDMNGLNLKVDQLNDGSGGGTVKLGSATLTVGDNNVPSFSGVISGTGGVTKTGSGTWTISGTNTYTGATLVNQGTLALGSATTLADASPVTVASGATLDLNGSSETIGSLAGAGTVAVHNKILSVGANNSTTTFSGVINGTNGQVTKTGTGIQLLSGSNTFTGGLNINQGTIEVGADANLGASSGALNFNGGTLQIDGTTLTSTPRSITWGANGGAFNIANSANTFTLNQLLSGVGPLTKNGTGTLILAGSQNYTGTTTINGGTLRADGTLTTAGGVITINSPGKLMASGTIPRAVTGNGSLVSDGSLTIGDPNSSSGFNFSGSLAIAGNSISILSLSAAQLSGNTSIAGGSLSTPHGVALSSAASLSGFGTVNGAVNNAGTVNGTDATNYVNFVGNVSGTGSFLGKVEFSGQFSPGNSPAQVSLGSPLLASTNTLVMELGGTTAGSGYDQLLISGTASLNGILDVELINGFTPASGNSFTLLSGGTLTGSFSSVSLPPFSNPDLSWRMTQTANQLTFSVVPEPSTGILFSACGTALFFSMILNRRRKTANQAGTAPHS